MSNHLSLQPDQYWRQMRIRSLAQALAATVHQLANRDIDQEQVHRRIEQMVVPMLEQPEAGHNWRLVRKERLHALLGLIDPAPVADSDGKVMVFRNPMAAEVLTRISIEVRAMVDEDPFASTAPINGN